MWSPHQPVQLLAVIFFAVFIMGQECQENESRRAVTEHQLMHDRGRTIQSLKRLIWLSGAMEGLHTAQTRSSRFDPPALVPGEAENPRPDGPDDQRRAAVDSMLRGFFNPYLSTLPEREP